MDILEAFLVRARATGGVFARSVAVPPWGLRLPGSIQLAVHTVIRGEAWLWVDDPASPGVGAAHLLRPGDLALVRGGPDHCIAHGPLAPCLLPDDFRHQQGPGAEEGDPRAAVFLCGAYRFAGDIGAGLVNALPPLLAIPVHPGDPLHGVITLLSQELVAENPGRQVILDRLLDVLVVMGLRTGLARSATPPPWFRGASDPRLASALLAIHGHPDHDWTVDQLAARCHLSRATFARVFQTVLGEAPMRYLTQWRMALARDLLRTPELALTRVAEQVGYSSFYAFSTAFRRHHGQPPGRWRQAQGAGVDGVEISRH